MDKFNKTIIGKDVIESLTIGMYDDSRFIYREYIQNAADQIDKARQQGLVSEGEIHINIDPDKKIISIEDSKKHCSIYKAKRRGQRFQRHWKIRRLGLLQQVSF